MFLLLYFKWKLNSLFTFCLFNQKQNLWSYHVDICGVLHTFYYLDEDINLKFTFFFAMYPTLKKKITCYSWSTINSLATFRSVASTVVFFYVLATIAAIIFYLLRYSYKTEVDTRLMRWINDNSRIRIKKA